MKQIKYFITTCILLLSYTIAYAQDYYNGDRIKGNGYEYIIDKKIPSTIYIDNINNILINTPAYVNGEEYPMSLVFLSQFIHFKDESVFNRLINDFFTKDEWNSVLNEKEELYFYCFFALSLDGDVLEIKYGIDNHPIFRKIESARLYELEKKLKESIKFYLHDPNSPKRFEKYRELNIPSLSYGFNTKPLKEYYMPK